MSRVVRAPLVALAASIGLIAVYLAFGGASYDPADVADPCQTRDLALLQERDLFETLALSSLDGAACELGVNREELALALADPSATQAFAEANGIDSAAIESAVRAGLIRAVDDAAAADKVSGLEETALRAIAENAPIGSTIEALQALPGDNDIQALLQRLGSLNQLDVPGLPNPEDIPGYDQFKDVFP